MNRILRAAFVIARRDFTALVRSRAFLFFLLGPMVMLGIALVAGSLGGQVIEKSGVPVVGVMMQGEDAARLQVEAQRYGALIGAVPKLELMNPVADPANALKEGRSGKGYAAIMSGSLKYPVLYASDGAARAWKEKVQLLIASARQPNDFRQVSLETHIISIPTAKGRGDRLLTAQMGQTVLFLLTMLLAGMVLSNLVEEKANKIIEILAASIPMESVFLGKLFAMLGMAWLGIAIWASAGGLLLAMAGASMPALPTPAVGWPVFLTLGVLYFSTAYLLLGSLFLSIGAMGATVRDVQTLSMPVTMGHLAIFMFATYALTHIGEPVEIAAAIFPFSSPFAMIARAAQQKGVWQQIVALIWQCTAAWGVILMGTAVFRRAVLKSGGGWRRRGKRGYAGNV